MSRPFDNAVAAIEELLGPSTHPDVEQVIALLEGALFGERREIALQLEREAAAYKRGSHVHISGRQHLTYDGGLRHAAAVIRDRWDG